MPFHLTSAHSGRVALTGLVIALGELCGPYARAQSGSRLLDRVGLDVTSVVDSSRYLIYRYRMTNSASSGGGVAVLALDVSATTETGRVLLPFTGRVEHGASGRAYHVPLGGLAPDTWKMEVLYNARFEWYAATVGAVVNDSWLPANGDSVAPGESRDGFGLRSPYLPGVRGFIAQPTWQACCSRPTPGAPDGEHAAPGAFLVRGFAVGPAVRPEAMSLALVQLDLHQACDPLRWIASGTVCGELRSTAERASAALKRGDDQGTKEILRAFLSNLDAQHGPGKPVNDNAYWLLKVNAEYVLAHM